MSANSATLSALREGSSAPREASLPAVAPGFGSLQSFELMQRAAKLLASSDLVPESYRSLIEKKDYRGNIKSAIENPRALANCVVALNMAQRMGADPLMVMQNLYIVEGRPSWSSQWIIAAINGCGRFSPLRFDIKPAGKKKVERVETFWEDGQKQTKKVVVEIDDVVAVAWALEKETGERLESPPVSIELAVREGWYTKNGSKWQTMPEVMLRYRTASFFGKLYAPELLMGLQTAEEMHDIIDVRQQPDGSFAASVDDLRAGPTPAPAPAAEPKPDPRKEAAEDATPKAEVETSSSEQPPAGDPDDGLFPPADEPRAAAPSPAPAPAAPRRERRNLSAD